MLHNNVLQRIRVAGNSKTYVGLYVKLPVFMSHFSQIWICSTDFHENRSIEFHRNPSSRYRSNADRRKDEGDKAIGASRN
jgi:hypothetical protein